MTSSGLQVPHAHRLRRARGHRVQRAFAILREWRRRIRARRELAALDDRMLRDIGISRAEAEFLSRKRFWRE
jgi:uncharacterized protein YjiS (DUF1127 family)